MTDIAFLGLGAMGSRMAAHLLDAGNALHVWNRNLERMRELKHLGAHAYTTPRAAVARADVVIAILRDDAASKSVWMDPDNGALVGMRPDSIAIESSTLSVNWAKALAEHFSEQRIPFLDAPVLGSRPQADSKQLIHVVGGESRTLEQVSEILSAYSSAIHHIGPNGAGASFKLVVNGLLGIQVAALGEMLGVLNKNTLSPDAAMAIFKELPTLSPVLKAYGALMASGEHAPLFPVDLISKDLSYLETLAHSFALDTPTTSAALSAYEKAMDAGFSQENLTAVAKLYLTET